MLVLQEGESQLLIIIPPNTPLLQNPHAIRAIQLGPAAAVCPDNRQARTHASVIVSDNTPFCNSHLSCQSTCMWQAVSSIGLLHTLIAGLRHRQSIDQFTWSNLSCLVAATHHMSSGTRNESVCASSMHPPSYPLLARLQASSLPVHPKHSSNSCRGFGGYRVSACPD